MKKSLLALFVGIALAGCSSEEDETNNPFSNPSQPSPPSIPTATMIVPFSISEPATGLLDTRIRVDLSNAYNEEITLQYTVVAVSADSRDVVEVSEGEITIPVDARSGFFDVTINPDNFDEDDEIFRVAFTGGTNVNFSTSNNNITIIDNDATPIVSFQNYTGNITQVAEGSGRFTIPMTVDTLSQKEITVPFTITGIATEGQDYSIEEMFFTIAPESDNGLIVLDLLSDSLPEGGGELNYQPTSS